MKIVGMVPARLQSTRLSQKALLDIEGLPMVIHTYKRAKLTKGFDDVFLVTDSELIKTAAEAHQAKVIMTSNCHQTGSDRIAEAAGGVNCDIVVNIQGDEPLVKPRHIEKLIDAMLKDSSLQAATLVCATENFNKLNECKVVLDLNNDILYMSRSDIPSSARTKVDTLYKLYCIVAFRAPFLKKFASWPPSPLEKIEYIEYLRIIEHGYKIRGVVVDEYTTSVDTPQDLETVRRLMLEDKMKFEYL